MKGNLAILIRCGTRRRRVAAAGFNTEGTEYEDAETFVFEVGGSLLQTSSSFCIPRKYEKKRSLLNHPHNGKHRLFQEFGGNSDCRRFARYTKARRVAESHEANVFALSLFAKIEVGKPGSQIDAALNNAAFS